MYVGQSTDVAELVDALEQNGEVVIVEVVAIQMEVDGDILEV